MKRLWKPERCEGKYSRGRGGSLEGRQGVGGKEGKGLGMMGAHEVENAEMQGLLSRTLLQFLPVLQCVLSASQLSRRDAIGGQAKMQKELEW